MRTFILVLSFVIGLISLNTISGETSSAVSSQDKNCENYWYEIICYDSEFNCWQFNYCGDVLTSVEPVHPY